MAGKTKKPAKTKIAAKKNSTLKRKATTQKIKKTVNKKTALKVQSKKVSAHPLSLKKPAKNPILSPSGDNSWEGWQTFNPGVVQLDDKVHFMYRAIGGDGISRLGYALSNDGYTIDLRHPDPAYSHRVRARAFRMFNFSGGSWGGAEDPRIVKVKGDKRLYMTYTACDGDLRVGLTSISEEDFLAQKWNWAEPVLISPPGEVHKNWVIFPEKINNKYAILHSINPEICIEYRDDLEFDEHEHIKSRHGGSKPRTTGWDKWIRGVGPVPLKTKYGWLVLYHAMDNDWSKYRVGAMLLDLKDPAKVIARSPAPVLEPNEHYENNGFKAGVVYASGSIVKDGELLVYYGGADSYVCIAHTNFETFMNKLVKHEEPKLKKNKLKNKK